MEAALADRPPSGIANLEVRATPSIQVRVTPVRIAASRLLVCLLALVLVRVRLDVYPSEGARRRTRAGLRPRGRRVHQGASRPTPTTRTRCHGLQRAKLRASEYHFNRGRRFAAAGEARRGAGRVPGRLRAEPDERRHREGAARSPQPGEGQGAGRRARARRSSKRSSSAPATCRRPGSTCRRTLKLPASLVFRDASSRDVFTAMGRFADVNVAVRPGVPRRPAQHRPPQLDASRTR